MKLPNVKAMYADMGKRIAATKPKLVCKTCKREVVPDAGAMSSYMSRGWPTCCGYTMELVTKK